MTNITRFALTSSAAVALLAGATSLSATAAPLGANLESLKSAAPAATETVQWRRHRNRNLAIGLGAFGLGVAAGAALSNRGYYYDEPYGYYGAPAYGYYEAPYGYYSAPNGNQPGSWDDPADFAGK
jgi:hypothetical protein